MKDLNHEETVPSSKFMLAKSVPMFLFYGKEINLYYKQI